MRKAQNDKVIADQGDGWQIIRVRSTNDFDAIITRDERGYIGSRATQTAARELIRETLLSAATH